MIELNLLPLEVQLAGARRRRIRQWSAAAVVAAMIAAIPFGMDTMRRLRADDLRGQNDALQSELTSTRTELRTLSASAVEATLQLERTLALRTKRSWSGLLAFIGSCLPDECWLTSVATDPPIPMGAGPIRPVPSQTAVAGTPPKEKQVVTIDAPRKLRISGLAIDAAQPHGFVSRLKESNVFQGVTLEQSVLEQGEAEPHFRFSLVCEW